MPKLTGIAVSLQSDDSLELVASSDAQGSGPTMWHTWQAGPGAADWNPWEPFSAPGTGNPGPPTLAQHADGQLEVFVVSSGDQAVWHRRQTGPEPYIWTDWESLGQPNGHPVQGPVATTLLNNEQVMAVVVAAGTVWQAVSAPDSNPQWSAWSSFGAPENGTVLAVGTATGRHGYAELVALVERPDDGATAPTGNSSVLWHSRQNDHATANDWYWWEPITPPAGDSIPVGTPLLAANGAGNLNLFTRTSDGAVWHTAQQKQAPYRWGPWEMLAGPGNSFGDLAAAVDQTSEQMLLVTPTSSGNQLWDSMESDGDPTTWSPLASLASVPEASDQNAGALASPLLAAESDGRMQLYVVVTATGNANVLTAVHPGELPTSLQSITHP